MTLLEWHVVILPTVPIMYIMYYLIGVLGLGVVVRKSWIPGLQVYLYTYIVKQSLEQILSEESSSSQRNERDELLETARGPRPTQLKEMNGRSLMSSLLCPTRSPLTLSTRITTEVIQYDRFKQATIGNSLNVYFTVKLKMGASPIYSKM